MHIHQQNEPKKIITGLSKSPEEFCNVCSRLFFAKDPFNSSGITTCTFFYLHRCLPVRNPDLALWLIPCDLSVLCLYHTDSLMLPAGSFVSSNGSSFAFWTHSCNVHFIYIRICLQIPPIRTSYLLQWVITEIEDIVLETFVDYIIKNYSAAIFYIYYFFVWDLEKTDFVLRWWCHTLNIKWQWPVGSSICIFFFLSSRKFYMFINIKLRNRSYGYIRTPYYWYKRAVTHSSVKEMKQNCNSNSQPKTL